MHKLLLAGVSTLGLVTAGTAVAGTDYSTAWHAQIGDTAAVQTAAKGGAGVTIGIVDTGIQANNPEIAGRVLTSSSCAAVTFHCPSGDADDNGHGTAVASIAAGAFSASAGISMSGVAPSATIVAEKVLNASGSGYDTDVANGIIKATQAGAKVINLSLTYIPTANVVAAVNYAAANNVTIVWAGGNSSQALNGGANTAGFSAAVASHLIFAGSVNSANQLSSFSNTPGAGALTVAGQPNTSYASLWLMAPGENIVAPGIQFGTGAYAYWTGTSMSTPEVSGAVALLDATWPVLVRNGTTSAVLLKTTTDLGAKGVDSTYGNGLLNIAMAFQPIGTLTVTEANGKSIAVSTLTGAMVTSGALGPLATVKTQLAAYTVFDSYQRNFTDNLSGLISTTGTSSNGQAVIVTNTGSSTINTGGGHFTLVADKAPSFGEQVFGAGGVSGIGDDLLGYHAPAIAYAEFAGNDGTFMGVGTGVTSTYSFAQAAWGAGTLAAGDADAIGASSALVGLAQGGYSASFGAPALGPVRFAAAWSATPPPVGSALAADRNRSQATATAIAVTDQVTKGWSVGVTVSSLNEDNALLGTTYNSAGPLSLGAHRNSRLVGLSSVLDLGGNRALMADASVVSIDGATGQGGLIGDVTPLTARAWGVSLIQGDALTAGDTLSLSVRQPLRVTAGSAQLAVTTVDDNGFPTTSYQSVGLAPAGHETDVSLGYAAPVTSWASFRGQVSLRSDAENTAGLNDVAVQFGTRLVW